MIDGDHRRDAQRQQDRKGHQGPRPHNGVDQTGRRTRAEEGDQIGKRHR